MVRKLLLVSITSLVFLSGCSVFWQNQYRSGSSSSLVNFLYPDNEVPPPVDAVIPEIKVPARIGIAFVPETGGRLFSEAAKTELLEHVKQRFIGRPFIEHIEIIPHAYLRYSRGFDGLDQLARLYSVDLIALVSHDQVAVTEDRASSLLYWTIIGGYMIKGSSNEVQTFVDTAVFDLSTRKLLFRAPGTDIRSKRSTAVGVDEARRQASGESIESAVLEMSENLDLELDRFRERVKQSNEVRLVNRDGSGGVGSMGWLEVVLLLLAMGLIKARTR